MASVGFCLREAPRTHTADRMSGVLAVKVGNPRKQNKSKQNGVPGRFRRRERLQREERCILQRETSDSEGVYVENPKSGIICLTWATLSGKKQQDGQHGGKTAMSRFVFVWPPTAMF